VGKKFNKLKVITIPQRVQPIYLQFSCKKLPLSITSKRKSRKSKKGDGDRKNS